MKKAFTLIELSIVAIIASILIVGVSKGMNLVKTARIANARSFTSKSIVPEINGLMAWWETSLKDSLKEDEAFDSKQVTRWYDISPASNLTTEETGKKNILVKAASTNVVYEPDGINKIPSLNFKGSDKFSLSSFYQGSSQQSTIFLVFRPFSFSTPYSYIYDNYYDYSKSVNRAAIGVKNSSVYLISGGLSNATISTTIKSSDYIMATYFNESSSKVFLNNAITAIGSANLSSNQMTGATIGGLGGTSNGTDFVGLISEVIVYNRPLNLQERKDIMSYLSKKYKISVTGV